MSYNVSLGNVGSLLLILGCVSNDGTAVLFGLAILICGIIIGGICEHRARKEMKNLDEQIRDLKYKINELGMKMAVMSMPVVPMKVNPEPPTVVNPVLRIDTTDGMPDMTAYRDWISTSNLRPNGVK